MGSRGRVTTCTTPLPPRPWPWTTLQICWRVGSRTCRKPPPCPTHLLPSTMSVVAPPPPPRVWSKCGFTTVEGQELGWGHHSWDHVRPDGRAVRRGQYKATVTLVIRERWQVLWPLGCKNTVRECGHARFHRKKMEIVLSGVAGSYIHVAI